MHHFSKAGLAAAALLLGTGAMAQVAGTVSVRAGFTHIAPQVTSGNLSAPAFPNTKVDVDAATSLSGGLNYMLTDHWAVDVPLALPFKHDIVGDGAIAGVGKLGQTKALPVTALAQYRFGEAEARFRPYVGVGVTYSRFFKTRSTAALSGLTGGTPAHPTTASIDNKWGITSQLGFVWKINDRWFLDAAYYKSFLKTTTRLSSGQSIATRLNPNVIAVGVGYQF